LAVSNALTYFPLKQKGKFPRATSFFVARGFPWRILRRRGYLWTSLVVVDQKANPAYPGFYNGGGSRRGAWPECLGT